MDFKLELVAVPVTDVDRAKRFYTEQAGFNADHDHKISDELRFVQLTPPGSACSIALGTGVTDAQPGSATGLQLVVADIEAARDHLVQGGVERQRGPGVPLGPVRVLRRPRRQPLGRPGDHGPQLTAPYRRTMSAGRAGEPSSSGARAGLSMPSASSRAVAMRRRVAEAAAVQVGADHQLAHVAAGGQRRQRVDQPGRLGLVAGEHQVVEGGADHGVQHVRAHPLVAVGGPGAADAGLGQPGGRAGAVAPGGAEQAEAAGGHALPAGVVQVVGQRPGVLELVGGGVEAAGAEVELPLERLRPGQERHPAFRAHQLEGVGQGGGGLAALVAEQVGPGQDRQRPGLLPRVGAPPGPLDRALEVAEGGRVVAHVGGVHAPDAQHGGQLDVGGGGRLGPGQPGLGRLAAAGLHVDVAQLPVGGHRRLAVTGLGGQPHRLVQDDGALLVAAADRVDQRAAQGGQGTALEG